MNYFDYAASTPLDDEAGEIYLKVAKEHFGNSQSLHDFGTHSSTLLESCRDKMAELLGIESKGVFFTSGGSEGNFLSILTLLSVQNKKGNHLITCAAEHSSVYNVMKKLELDGWEITYLPLNANGIIDIEQFIKSIRDDTVLASIHHGNSEIGTIQPIKELSLACREKGILFHTDCVQTFCKVTLNEFTQYVDALSISGHKVYGPKGTGAVYLNPKIPWKPFIPNTTHEKGFRAGTVNVPGIAAMITAANKKHLSIQKDHLYMIHLREAFLSAIQQLNGKIKIFGSSDQEQLPGIIGMSISGIEGQMVLLHCNQNGFAISTGSACQAGMQQASKTIISMGIKEQEAKGFFRISFGNQTTIEDVKELAACLNKLA